MTCPEHNSPALELVLDHVARAMEAATIVPRQLRYPLSAATAYATWLCNPPNALRARSRAQTLQRSPRRPIHRGDDSSSDKALVLATCLLHGRTDVSAGEVAAPHSLVERLLHEIAIVEKRREGSLQELRLRV